MAMRERLHRDSECWHNDNDSCFLCPERLVLFFDIPCDVDYIDVVVTKRGNAHSYDVTVGLNEEGEDVVWVADGTEEIFSAFAEFLKQAAVEGLHHVHIEYDRKD
jgi:hypothetical protein